MAADDTTAKFAVDLRDGVSATSASAADAIEALKKTIVGGTAELRQIQAAMSRLKAGGLAGSQAFKDLRNKADALKKSIGTAQEELISLGGALTDLKPAKPAADLDELLSTLTKLPGPFGALFSRLGGVTSAGAFASAGITALAGAAVAAAAAMTAFVAAVAAATSALLAYGVAAASARRDELLHLEGLVSIRTWYSRAAGSAVELQASIDRVSESSAISRSRVAGYAEQLYRAGLRGQTLQDALEGVSTVAAVQGEAMAERFRGMAVAAARTGGSVRRLTDQMQARLGGTAARMGLAWGRQMERLRESWSALFRDLELDGALAALGEVLKLFSQSTASGRALRAMLTAAFQPILDGVRAAGPPLQRFIEGAIIAALDLGIAVLLVRNSLRRSFGDVLPDIAGFVDATTVGRVVVFSLAAALLTCLGAFAAVTGGIVAMLAVANAPLIAIGALAYGIVRIGQSVTGLAQSIRETLGGIDWSGIGRDMIAGLARGLGLDGPAMEAIAGLASRLTSALRGALDIHSPSRVFAALGRQIPRGLAVGVEAESGTSTAAIEGIAEATPAGLSAGSSRAARGDVYVSIDGIQVVVGSASDAPQGLAERVREALEQVLAGVLVETGSA